MRTVRFACFLIALTAFAQGNRGYYRFPSLHGDTVVFTAEGDLWSAPVAGGAARRLTTHQAEEQQAYFSPDGKLLAFTANYEGAPEVYTIPADGGLPARRTFGGGRAVGWTNDGKVLFATRQYSAIGDLQLATVDAGNKVELVPLHQAAQGVYDSAGKTLYFTRLPFQGSHAKRYQGGTAQKLWKFTPGSEAVPLTADYAGTSKDAMYWKGRVYFASDRDGTMNLWSMDETGKNLKQHTKSEGWDIKNPALQNGRVVYQLGADLHVYDIASGQDRKVDVQLSSDFDHLRERWVNNPAEYLTAVSLSHDGSKLTLTSRGRAFVIPAKQGRIVDATGPRPARFRSATLLPDGKNLLVLSTESGEVELWKMPANGIGEGERLTTDGKVLRWEAVPSPDGKWVVHTDKENQLWLLEVATKQQKLIATDRNGGNSSPAFSPLRWSPDSRWLLYSAEADNDMTQVKLYNVESGVTTPLTTDRYNSRNASWSLDGKFIYFLSDRSLRSVVPSPWGARAPDPYFDRSMKIYQMALRKGLRSPFEPADELHPDTPDTPPAKPAADKKDEKPKIEPIEIDLEGISARIEEVPVPPGNYASLTAPAKRLCWINADRMEPEKTALQCLDINNKGDKPETLMEGIRSYQLSGDGKKLLLQKGSDFYVLDASIKEGAAKTPKTLADAKVDLKDWNFYVIPTVEYREALLDAWRLHRDYFYDRNMHGVNWALMKDKYGELVGRVRDRAELNDLIAQMVSELSVLHSSVRGGDQRQAPDRIRLGTFGAYLERDQSAGGWVVKQIYVADPDRPDLKSPLSKPGVDVGVGDVIVTINGRETLAATHPQELLRNQAGKQVLVRVKPSGKTETRDVVIKPLTEQQDAELRVSSWEYGRRVAVDKASNNKLGYLHLRAMGPQDIAQFAEQYYPVFDREGLIIDVRNNGGGNIDSWILAKLMRKAWMYWQGRVGKPTWNMQYAFRGPMVVLVDEWTGSDGEAFAEGFRRLGLGKVIGTRTWGGEVWLSGSNALADRGIATAAETGVYGPERQWLIEGHGVDPDIVVDNLPNATFNGNDAQLDAAIKYLQEMIKKQPNPVPAPPPYPDKSGKAPKQVSSR